MIMNFVKYFYLIFTKKEETLTKDNELSPVSQIYQWATTNLKSIMTQLVFCRWHKPLESHQIEQDYK